MSGSLGSIARIGIQLAATAYFGPVGGAVAGIGMGLLFPEKLPGVEGPRLGPDQGMTSAQIGAAIPILFGTIDINGNVIQDLGRVEHEETEEQGGKGGPTQEVTTYTYTRTYAVLLADCQDNRPIDGILRIWRNAKLVYDVRSQQAGESDSAYVTRQAASMGFLEHCAIYLGTPDQLPDPILEAAVGVGLQPAYRHRAYIVFYDEDVTDNGGRTSQWKFEVVCNGTFTPSDSVEWTQGILYDWVDGRADPRDARNGHEYKYVKQAIHSDSQPSTVWRSTLDDAFADFAADTGFSAGQATTLMGWSVISGSDQYTYDVHPYAAGLADQVRHVLNLHFNDFEPSEGYEVQLTAVGADDSQTDCRAVGSVAPTNSGKTIWWGDRTEFDTLPGDGGGAIGIYYRTTDPSNTTLSPRGRANNNCPSSPGGGQLKMIPDVIIQVRRIPGAPGNPCDGYPALPENPDFCVIDGQPVPDAPWSKVTGVNGYKALQRMLTATVGGETHILSEPVGPLRPVGHEDDTAAFWNNSYSAAVTAGTVGAGKAFDAQGDGDAATTYPNLQDFGYTRTSSATVGDPLPVTLASIVTTICRRCSPLTSDDIDVSMLDETVKGYRIDRIMSGRAGIDTLRQYGYFDCVDGAILSFPTRGRESVATLDDDTLGTSDGDGFVPAVTPTFAEAPELPRFVGVRYPMPHADYVVGMQQTQRGNVDTTNKSYIDVPISMSDDKAKQITEVLMGETWVGRETYKLSISPRLMALEAADAIEVPVSGELQRMVISSLEGGYPGPLQTEARRDDQYVYLSTAAGVASGITEQGLGIAGLTVYALIDSTALTSDEDDAGFYVAAYGTGDRWRGASLYESMDAGANYSRVLSVSTASTMGTIDSALPAGPHHIWDEFNTLTVTLRAGTLESRTEAAVLNGANAAFIGAADRWELIQFRTATLIGDGQYTLSGLLRGRRGTEWAVGLSQDGDTFALASTLARVPKSNSAIGLSRLYKMVTSRTLLEASTPETFTPEGVALETYAPAHVTASRDGSNNINGTIVRRARLGPEWLDYADIPMNEESEHYQLDIFVGSAFLRTIDVVGTNVWGYTAAEQTADGLIPGDDVTLLAYQLSAVVGRGYPYEATV